MRGGRFQQKVGEEASSRNAEALFESRSVVDIREVEGRMCKDIEEKKEELRQLVGASYRDLIESADSILEMQRSCEAVGANISKMEEGFTALHRSVGEVKSSPGEMGCRLVFLEGSAQTSNSDCIDHLLSCFMIFGISI